eukprot:scaffold30090_cov112-Isochrysis_galbana.AAC.3
MQTTPAAHSRRGQAAGPSLWYRERFLSGPGGVSHLPAPSWRPSPAMTAPRGNAVVVAAAGELARIATVSAAAAGLDGS